MILVKLRNFIASVTLPLAILRQVKSCRPHLIPASCIAARRALRMDATPWSGENDERERPLAPPHPAHSLRSQMSLNWTRIGGPTWTCTASQPWARRLGSRSSSSHIVTPLISSFTPPPLATTL